MNRFPPFLELPDTEPERADVLLLALPYEGTVSQAPGTAQGPSAIWSASQHVELWDEELDWELDRLGYHSPEPLAPAEGMQPGPYHELVEKAARQLHRHPGLVVGVGGEHSVTPPLVAAARDRRQDYSDLTVVQIDAHADLRDQYHGTPYSHACAMRRLLDRGATILAIGIRSADRDEFRQGQQTGRVRTFFAQSLAEDPQVDHDLMVALGQIAGDCYLTVDMDGLEAGLCPATGTPQPGGLRWWQTLRYVRRLLRENDRARLLGMDVVETVPDSRSRVNEMAAAKLLTKAIAYHFCPLPSAVIGRAKQ